MGISVYNFVTVPHEILSFVVPVSFIPVGKSDNFFYDN
jgi:hypothetical protein